MFTQVYRYRRYQLPSTVALFNWPGTGVASALLWPTGCVFDLQGKLPRSGFLSLGSAIGQRCVVVPSELILVNVGARCKRRTYTARLKNSTNQSADFITTYHHISPLMRHYPSIPQTWAWTMDTIWHNTVIDLSYITMPGPVRPWSFPAGPGLYGSMAGALRPGTWCCEKPHGDILGDPVESLKLVMVRYIRCCCYVVWCLMLLCCLMFGVVMLFDVVMFRDGSSVWRVLKLSLVTNT